MTCTVINCTSNVGVLIDNNTNISFHRFPADVDLRKTWIKNVGKGDKWNPTKHTRICSLHFDKSCFRKGYERKLLHSFAVPTIFPNQPLSCKAALFLSSLKSDGSEDSEDGLPRKALFLSSLKSDGSEDSEDGLPRKDQPGPSRSPAPQDFWDGRVSPITDPEDDEAEVMAEPVCGDGEPTTSTTPVIKIEIEDHKEELLKLQQEVETLKAENQRLIARNHNLAREIFNLKQTSHVLRKDDAIEDTDSIDNDLLSQLAIESHRLSEKISDYADKIQKITSKYEIDEETMDIDGNDNENLDLTNKLRRLIEDNENVIGERDKLKDKVQSLLVDLENVSEENKALKTNVKLQRKRIEMLRIQCVGKTRNLKRLENSCFILKSMFSKLKMARQNF